MRILITGGTGYLGARFAQLFLNEGNQVVLLLRKRTGRFPVVVADITDEHAVRQAFEDVGKVDGVLHLAGLEASLCAQNPERALLVNRDGTRNVFLAAEARGIPLVYASTIHVYGKPEGVVTEDTPTEPVHPYGESKLAGELVLSEATTRVAIGRLSNAVGPPANDDIGQWHLALLDFCRSAHERGEIVLKSPGYQQRDFIDVEDAYRAFKTLLEDGNGVYNVCSGTNFSIRELAQSVQEEYKELYNQNIQLLVPEGSPEPVVRFVNDRLQSLGWRAEKNIKDSVRETLRYCERFR